MFHVEMMMCFVFVSLAMLGMTSWVSFLTLVKRPLTPLCMAALLSTAFLFVFLLLPCALCGGLGGGGWDGVLKTFLGVVMNALCLILIVHGVRVGHHDGNKNAT